MLISFKFNCFFFYHLYSLWSSKFLPFHYKCIELTGDSEYEDMKAFLNINIIVTTPEKWDSLCRKSSFMKVLNNIELVLIDEIHTINDETRGPVLESLVSRMKLLRSSSNSSKQLRFVTLSATIPNVQDVCEWISYRENDGKYFQIGDETRPVKLKTIVIGYDCPASANDFQFDLELNRQLHKVIEQYSQRRPTLIFASTRKITEKTAEHLSSKHNYAYSLEMRNEFRQIELQLKDAKLRETLKCGVGFHHAGLDCKDRERIQEAFTEGKIPVLISTSTLALGVNLPAHLVIIKGTFQYVNGVCQQYDENQILQMIGRAGRPQFDTEATAVIMTKKALQTKFECYINSSKIVESQLHRCFAENLNTEIYLGLIRNVESAFSWAQSTFLYVRLFKNPQHYGYMDNWSHTRLVNHLKMSILFEIETLIKYDLIKKNEDDEIVSTQIGRIMAENYVCLATMKRFFEIESGATISLLLQLICDCNELLQDTQIRNADKLTLNKLNVVDRKANLFGLRYPIRKPLNTAQKKVNCLIQSFLGCNSLNETPLLSEATKIMKTAGRISKCLMEYLLVVPKGYATLLNAILLSKSISAGIWENSEYVSKQLPRIGITLSTKLVNSNYRTFDSILNANSRDLELLLNKNPPFADKLKENIEDLPKYELNIRQKPINAGILNAALIIQVKLIRDQRSQRFPFHASIILLANEDDRVLLVERIPDSYLLSSKTGATFELTVEKVKKGTVFVHLISERIVGIDRTIQFDPQYQGQRRRLAPVDPDDLSYLEMQFGQ